jgi:hypothetical protein
MPTNGRQRYCTRAHWREDRGGPAERACRLCGRSFAPTSGNHRYCTPAHQCEHQRRQREARTVAELRERKGQLEAELAELRAREAA